MNFKQLVDEVAREIGFDEALRREAAMFADSQSPSKRSQKLLEDEIPDELVEPMKEMMRQTYGRIKSDPVLCDLLSAQYHQQIERN